MIHRPSYYRKRFAIFLLITVVLVVGLNFKWGPVPPFGKLLNPFAGFWHNAEKTNYAFTGEENIEGLQKDVQVLYDDNRIPHLFAENNHDLYFMQGYLTARDRLWQMELQTHAAAGRVCEILGNKALEFDRRQRRKGMVWAAERCWEEVSKDANTKLMVESYSEGVTAYIEQLSPKDYPVEYKLLNYAPEPWTPLKCMLMLKLMSDDLSGYSNDVAYTNAVKIFGRKTFDEMYPDFVSYNSPIVPKGTPFNFKTVAIDSFGVKKQVDSIRLRQQQYYRMLQEQQNSAVDSNTMMDANRVKQEMPNGSNNFAVAGSKTKSGYPILCGDPHLKLSLPSIWYEVQLNVNGKNVQGASLPGAPGVIIGFNDSCAWSMTNAERDVRDLYTIKFKDATQKEYWLDGKWQPTEQRIEEIKVRNGSDYLDTVYYTVFGPVLTDKNFTDENIPANTAISWMAHLPSNEVKTIYQLNRANNYKEYVSAISNFKSPAQNFVFASKNKDIAIWQQGRFVAKWYEQGKFIQPGDREGLVWKYFIPDEQNPHSVNPLRGFVSSANQTPTDSTYPYYYYGDYPQYRSLIINNYLSANNHLTVNDMQHLQTNSSNMWATEFLLAAGQHLNLSQLNTAQQSFYQSLSKWDFQNTPQNELTLFFRMWYDELTQKTFSDEFNQAKIKLDLPNKDVFIHIIANDSSFVFWDDVTTSLVEKESQIVTRSFDSAYIKYNAAPEKQWGKFRNTSITHLAKLEPFSVKVNPAGEANSPNAMTNDHGPSWRMVVSLTPQTQAYAIYPGGQSGNPGSSYYDNLIPKWEAGQYDSLITYSPADVSVAKSVQIFHKK